MELREEDALQTNAHLQYRFFELRNLVGAAGEHSAKYRQRFCGKSTFVAHKREYETFFTVGNVIVEHRVCPKGFKEQTGKKGPFDAAYLEIFGPDFEGLLQVVEEPSEEFSPE